MIDKCDVHFIADHGNNSADAVDYGLHASILNVGVVSTVAKPVSKLWGDIFIYIKYLICIEIILKLPMEQDAFPELLSVINGIVYYNLVIRWMCLFTVLFWCEL